MKAKLIFAASFGLFILVACMPAKTPILTKATTPSQTSTPVPTTLTPTPTIEWMIVATPLHIPSSDNEEIISIIDKLHPSLCIRNTENLLLITPTPIESARQVSPVKFIEINTVPKPNPGYTNERADNIDKSRTAYAIPELGAVNKLYVKDNKAGKFFQIDFGATDRPLDWLQWINNDTVIVAQQGHLWIIIAAINVAKQQYEYYGITSGCPIATPTP